jgi:hypothetical protein
MFHGYQKSNQTPAGYQGGSLQNQTTELKYYYIIITILQK